MELRKPKKKLGSFLTADWGGRMKQRGSSFLEDGTVEHNRKKGTLMK